MREATVVLVHGLYTNGWDMSALRMRLSASGFAVHRFVYPSLSGAPADNAAALDTFVAELHADTVHFVAHSLGGLVVRHLFALQPTQPQGRIVTLGTPHMGSSAARWIESHGLAGILGRSVDGGLLGALPEWTGARELGGIAGTLRLGLGWLIPGLQRPNDGTVTVAETRLTLMTDHIVMPVSHFGMLLSRGVAIQVESFLRDGRFVHGAGA